MKKEDVHLVGLGTFRRVTRNRQRWPGLYGAFEHAVTEWFLARKAEGARLCERTPEEYLLNWYRGIA